MNSAGQDVYNSKGLGWVLRPGLFPQEPDVIHRVMANDSLIIFSLTSNVPSF